MSGPHAVSRAASLLLFFAFGLTVWVAGSLLTIPVLSQDRIRPVTDPTSLRRLSLEDLKYAGAFRLPSTESNGDSFSFGGAPMAYNPGRNSLFVGTHSGKVAEISIPAPAIGSIDEFPSADYLQGFADPTEGGIKEIASDGAALSGLLVHRDRLYGTGSIYYDANNSQTLSHFSRPLMLSEKGAGPMRAVGAKGRTGFVAGYLALVPPEWQSKLGGPAITGQCCIPIVSRTSWGPAAFAWEPGDLDKPKGAIEAAPLVYYSSEHPTLGQWEASNPTYGGTTQMGGVALIDGTRTALFFGRTGTGPFCYGDGTGDQALANSTGPGGEKYCYDPSSSDKGQHAYPYRFQIWAYDLNDWAAVRAGRDDPWEVKPYGVWPIELPTPGTATRIGGVAYDPARRALYISQLQADRDGYAYRALIHVFHIP